MYKSKKYQVDVFARSWVFSIDQSLLGTKSIGTGGATFYENSNTPDPHSFNGVFAPATMSFGFVWSPFTGAVMGKNLGDLRGFGMSSDFYAIEMGKGDAKVLKYMEIECCE